MNRPWGGGRWKNNRWDNRDPWQYREEESDYGWLKRLVVAALIFVVVYGVCATDTSLGKNVAEGVHYVMTAETDFAYLADKIAVLVPKNMDVSVLKRVQNTVLKPADPLMYMTKPVEGKVLNFFGWQTDPVSRQPYLNEGLSLESPAGTPVKAAAAGKVKQIVDSAQHGKMLIVEHSIDVDTMYGCLGEVLVKVDEAVSQGQIIARSGKNPKTAQQLLYFEVREKGKAIDPLNRLKSMSQ